MKTIQGENFSEELQKLLEGYIETALNVSRDSAIDLFSDVIDDTPIWFEHEEHAGNTKYNWRATSSAPSQNVLKGTDKSGEQTKDRMESKVNRAFDNKSNPKVYFSNAVPWIWDIEDGHYPSPVKEGSYNSKTGQMEIRSEGGFSKQAPLGMVKKNIVGWVERVESFVRRYAK